MFTCILVVIPMSYNKLYNGRASLLPVLKIMIASCLPVRVNIY